MKNKDIDENNGNLNVLADINPQVFKGLIHEFRGTLVMLDADLAAIYGYSTKDFNHQVKNNIERFDEDDLMFQLSTDEVAQLSKCKNCTLNTESLRCKNCTSNDANGAENLMSKFLTSNNDDNAENLRLKFLTSNDDDDTENLRLKNSISKRGGRRYAPYAFTEQGIYMLMTVLKGPLAVKQSKSLVRLFKQMKDYIIQNQPLLGQREYLQLSIQTSDNIRNIMELRTSLTKLDDKVAKMADEMGEVVTHSELSNVLLDFGNPVVRRGWLILNGQPVESDLAYKQIYESAKASIIIVDDYINLKTLSLLRNVPPNVKVTVLSDNTHDYLHRHEVEDFRREFPDVNLSLISDGGIFHDRYIIINYGTDNEHFYHCGASSKDGGNKVMTISSVEDTGLYHPLIDTALANPELELK